MAQWHKAVICELKTMRQEDYKFEAGKRREGSGEKGGPWALRIPWSPEQNWILLFLLHLFIMYEWGLVGATQCVWKSEDSLGVLSSHHVGPRIKLGSSGLAVYPLGPTSL